MGSPGSLACLTPQALARSPTYPWPIRLEPVILAIRRNGRSHIPAWGDSVFVEGLRKYERFHVVHRFPKRCLRLRPRVDGLEISFSLFFGGSRLIVADFLFFFNSVRLFFNGFLMILMICL